MHREEKDLRIRAENDSKILKNFTPHQRKIRSEWRNRTALKVSEKSRDNILEELKNFFISIGGVENGE